MYRIIDEKGNNARVCLYHGDPWEHDVIDIANAMLFDYETDTWADPEEKTVIETPSLEEKIHEAVIRYILNDTGWYLSIIGYHSSGSSYNLAWSSLHKGGKNG